MSCSLNVTIILNVAPRLGERTRFRHRAWRGEGECSAGVVREASLDICTRILLLHYCCKDQLTASLGFVVPESGRHKFGIVILQFVSSDTTFLVAAFLLFALMSAVDKGKVVPVIH
jgi:hypothetical protein